MISDIFAFKRFFYLLTNPSLYRKINNWQNYLSGILGVQKSVFKISLNNKIHILLRNNQMDVIPVQEIVLRDDYELKNINKNLNTIIDLGSHIGVFSIVAAEHFSKSIIYAFEAEKENYVTFFKNIRLNKFSNRIKSYLFAITGKDNQKINIYKNKGMGCLYEKTSLKSEVFSITLDKIYKKFRIKKCDLLKIDIEGSEYEVLYTASDNIYKKTDRINLEFHNINIKENYNGKSLVNFLIKKGYQVKYKNHLDGKTGMIYAKKF